MPRVAATAVRPLPAQAAMAPCSLRHPALARQLAAGVRRRYTVSDIATPFHQTALPGLQQESSKPWARPAVMPAPAAPSALHRVWSAYLQSLATRPLLTKAATSFVCVVIGDTIAQAIGGELCGGARGRQPGESKGHPGGRTEEGAAGGPPPPSCPTPPLLLRRAAGTPYSILRVLRLAAYSSTVGATTGTRAGPCCPSAAWMGDACPACAAALLMPWPLPRRPSPSPQATTGTAGWRRRSTPSPRAA